MILDKLIHSLLASPCWECDITKTCQTPAMCKFKQYTYECQQMAYDIAMDPHAIFKHRKRINEISKDHNDEISKLTAHTCRGVYLIEQNRSMA